MLSDWSDKECWVLFSIVQCIENVCITWNTLTWKEKVSYNDAIIIEATFCFQAHHSRSGTTCIMKGFHFYIESDLISYYFQSYVYLQ